MGIQLDKEGMVVAAAEDDDHEPTGRIGNKERATSPSRTAQPPAAVHPAAGAAISSRLLLFGGVLVLAAFAAASIGFDMSWKRGGAVRIKTTRGQAGAGGAGGDGVGGGGAVNVDANKNGKRDGRPPSSAHAACLDAFPYPATGSQLSYYPSFRSVWDRVVRPFVRDAVVEYERQRAPKNLTAAMNAFGDWMDDVVAFQTFERLQRSMMNPAPHASIRRLLELVQRRRTDPERNPPVRVLVLGGSVLEGITCSMNQVGLPIRSRLDGDPTCSWPNRLEHLLNTVLFPGQRSSHHALFEVQNAAKGGFNSLMGGMLLEYQLLPWVQDNVPDVVVLGYSANDAQNPDPNATFEVHMPALVKAAHNLRPCDVELPLVVLADDMYGREERFGAAIQQTGSVYQTAAWFHLMAVSYFNVGRYQAVAAFHNYTSLNPLYGSYLDIHLGMGYHVAMAITMLFNIVSALHTSCEAIVVDDDEERPEQDADRRAPPSKYLPDETFIEPLPKDMGRYGPTGDVKREWQANVRERERRCAAPSAGATTATDTRAEPSRRKWSNYSTAVCEYAWLMNPMTGVYSPEAVTDAVGSVLTYNDGWTSPNVSTKNMGWQIDDTTNTRKSGRKATNRFELTIPNVTVPTKYLTVVSMKSYSEKWLGTRLNVSVLVKKATGIGATNGTATTAAPNTISTIGEVSGYHKIKTSVYFPNKFEIPGGGADVGDTIVATFDLVAGATFKIGGLALCQW